MGYDFYRGAFMSYSGYHSMARVLKLMNASLRYTWSAEFMAGTWKKVLKERVSDDHMRFMARCALAHGCKAIDWFMFHDRDCWGDAPVSSHGHIRPSYAVLREIPEILFHRVANWDALVPQTDVAVVYDRIQHVHTAIGDPKPCADNTMHQGRPRLAGVEAGVASREYTGLFRLIEQAGAQAAAVDILHSAAVPGNVKLAFLPGSPVIERSANRTLKRFVSKGGALVLTGAWPTLDEAGRPLKFLGMDPPPGRSDTRRVGLGKGRILWRPECIAQEEAESERIASIRLVAGLLRRYGIRPHVSMAPVEPARWIDWQPGGGHAEVVQERNLGSAVLHSAGDAHLLFALNHYPEAVRFRVRFGRLRPKRLLDLSSGASVAVRNGTALLDIDRKCCEIFAVEA